MSTQAGITLRPAEPADAALIATLIRELAEYEKLLHECHATTENIRQSLFGGNPHAECVIAELHGAAVGFALFLASMVNEQISRRSVSA
ncbi:MAG: hypothetical protein V4709_09285 [Pseudomonadota bacterium]